MGNIKTTKRAYSYRIVSYADRTGIDPLLLNAKHWAYILHDKDVNKDGELLTPHYHILATFDRALSQKQVYSMVNSDQNTFAEEMKDVADDFDYLDHNGIPDKYHYPKSDIIMDDEVYWNQRIRDPPIRPEEGEFIEDLLSSDYDIVNMAKKYGRDFIRYYNAYSSFRAIALGQKKDCMEDKNEARSY